MKVGDKIFVARSGSWETHYTSCEVVKITPKGLVDVKLGSTEIRFKLKTAQYSLGEQYGGSEYTRYWIDATPYAEREAFLASEGRARVAVSLIKEIYSATGVNLKWGKDGLEKEVARLQEMLNKAKEAVEAI